MGLADWRQIFTKLVQLCEKGHSTCLFYVQVIKNMKRHIVISLILLTASLVSRSQDVERRDTFPRPIPDLLSPQLFIPADRLEGLLPWTYAPMLRPVVHIFPVYGFDGSVGFGEFNIEHPDRFFSTLTGANLIDVPEIFVSEQKMIGNTLKLGRKFYFMSGIMYGAQLGVRGNNWGMGTREGLIYRGSDNFYVSFWTQYFQSVAVYSPVLFPDKNGDGAAVRMPATPEVFSLGVQASFVAGEFIIGVGLSVAPVPFQYRHHTEFRYK